MKRRNVILTAGVLALLSLGAQAQQPVSVDLEQALRIALSDNPTIRIADMEVERQDYVRKETWGNLLPKLSGTVGYQNAIVKNTITGGVSLSPTHTVSFGGDLTVPLVAPGVYQSLKLNKEQLRAAVESARASRIDMSCEVKKAFYNILRIDQEIEVLRASRKNVSTTVEDLRSKLAHGLTSEYDLLTAEVQLSNIDPLLIQAERGREVAHMYLKMLMGMPLETEVDFVGDLAQLERTYGATAGAYGTDLSGNSDLRSLDIQESILSRQLKVMRTQRMPTLGATLSGSVIGQDPINFNVAALSGGMMGWQSDGSYVGQPYGQWKNDGSGTDGWMFIPPAPDSETAASNDFRWQNPVTLSFGLSIPIFAGFTNTSREKQLRNNLRQLQARRDYTEKQIEVQVNTSVSNIYTAQRKMAATTKTVQQAGKAYEIANVRYKAGAGTILELNSAELQLTQSQLNHSQAVYDLLAAQAEYEKILGNE